MVAVPIQLAGLWVMLMLTYLLGDVLRIFSGDAASAKMSMINLKGVHWLLIAVLMLLPILMIYATLMLPLPVNRILNIVMAGFFFLFNLVGLPTYPSAYDKFLIAVGLVFNIITIWTAWNWS